MKKKYVFFKDNVYLFRTNNNNLTHETSMLKSLSPKGMINCELHVTFEKQ